MDIGQGQLSYAIWLTLPPEIKHKLVTLFDIPRSGRTVVEYRATGAVVTSDGYTAPDLQSISLAKMQGLTGSDSDNFYKLFEVVILNLDALLGGTIVAPTAPVERVTSKNPLQPVDPEKVIFTEFPKIFCDSCDSKGVRHKKVCPKYA